MTGTPRDHGGGLDAAMARYGGGRADWIDLSTGINPNAYPIGDIPDFAWQALPDKGAEQRLLTAARRFWQVPEEAAIVAASGVSALISQLPTLCSGDRVAINKPTYNEHEAAFRIAGFDLDEAAGAQVLVHPNNPDGRLYSTAELAVDQHQFTIIDESFCDCAPDRSHVALTARQDVLVLKGLGKFWGLAGLRLGFAMGAPDLIARLADRLGPWAVSGPALHVGATALEDQNWAADTRNSLAQAAARLDAVAAQGGLSLVGGTDLFRLYSCSNSITLHEKLAKNQILTRVFPYSKSWIRIGLPRSEADWRRLACILGE